MKYLLEYSFVCELNFLTQPKTIVILEGKNESTPAKLKDEETPKDSSRGG